MAAHTNLAKVIDRLGKTLPKKKHPIDELTEEEEWSVRAYVVLCHAAIEAEIERQCIETARRVLASATKGQFGTAAMSLMLHRFSQLSTDGVEAQAESLRKDRLALIKAAVNTYVVQVRDGNHGIKAKHLKAMLSPLGVDIESLDPQAVAALEQLGAKRGAIAHDLSPGIGEEYHAASVLEWTEPFRNKSNNAFAEVNRILEAIHS